MQTPTLETSRLILRPIQAGDALWVQQLFPQWEVVKYLRVAVPWPYPANGANDFIKNVLLPAMRDEKAFAWAVIEKASKQPMGLLELTPFSEGEHRGFWLAPEFHGKGYMTEAVIATTDFAFDVLGVKELCLGNAKGNIASCNIKLKAGAELIDETAIGDYVIGNVLHQTWRLTPEMWKKSAMKNLK